MAIFVEASMLKAAHHAMSLAYGDVVGDYDDVKDWSEPNYPCKGCADEFDVNGFDCGICKRMGCGMGDYYKEKKDEEQH